MGSLIFFVKLLTKVLKTQAQDNGQMYLKAHSERLSKYDPPNIQGSHSWMPLVWKLPVNMNVSIICLFAYLFYQKGLGSEVVFLQKLKFLQDGFELKVFF